MSDVATTINAPVLEFLRWIASTPRSYAETMEAWRTSCPRLAVWEDASIAGYVELRSVDGRTVVVLTTEGRAVLAV